MSPQYLTVEEVSDYLKLPEETVYKYARSGRIPASKVGRYWRFERSRIDEWVNLRSNQPPRSVKVFVVDDDPAVRGLFAGWLRAAGCEVSVFAGGEEALAALEGGECDVLLLDLMMPEPGGPETLRRIRQHRPGLDVVIVTAFFDGPLMDRALEFGPLTILKKPVERDVLLTAAIGVPEAGVR